MPTDTTEKGLETLIMRHMTGEDGIFLDGVAPVMDTPDGIAADKAGGALALPMHTTGRTVSTLPNSSLSSKPPSRTRWPS
jgi:hypothetical protein